MPLLPFKNSLICCPVRASAFSMRICTRPPHVYLKPPIFRIILCWNQRPLQDHLVLDNSAQTSVNAPMLNSGGTFMRFGRIILAVLAPLVSLPALRTDLAAAGNPANADSLAGV